MADINKVTYRFYYNDDGQATMVDYSINDGNFIPVQLGTEQINNILSNKDLNEEELNTELSNVFSSKPYIVGNPLNLPDNELLKRLSNDDLQNERDNFFK
jgi:hypothetical protein